MVACFAVMGNPVAHSLSPVIHHHFAQQTGVALRYEKMLVPEGGLATHISRFFAQGGRGLNITLPFKQEAYALASVLTARCQQAHAANTLWMKENKLHADNTDGVGLIRDLSRHIDLANKRVVVLGAGGAARGIITPLLDASVASLTVLSRTAEKGNALQFLFPAIVSVPRLSEKDSYDLIINATSAGINKTVWNWDFGCLLSAPFCYDLSYFLSEPTPFVQWAHAAGCCAIDGLGMLVEQAAEAFLIWNGVFPETTPVLKLLRAT